jgi:hypothetical protein
MLSRTLNNSIKEISPIGGVLVFGSATTHLRFRATGKTGSPFFICGCGEIGRHNIRIHSDGRTELLGVTPCWFESSRPHNLLCIHNACEHSSTGVEVIDHPYFFYGSYDSFLFPKSSKEQLINNSINGYRNTPDLLKIGRTSVHCDSDTTTPLKQLRKFSIIGAILSDLANKAYCVAVFYSTHDLKGI